MIFRSSILVIAITCLFTTTSSTANESGIGAGIEVMFYNAHNLFDAEHDEGKQDWTYLPKGYPGKSDYCKSLTNPYWKKECEESNWTEASVELKLNQLTKAVTQGRKTLPDVLGLCEVENDNIVGQFAQKLGYSEFVMTNSPDKRGIDVALMFRNSDMFEYVSHTEHVVEGAVITRPTRNILEVEFRIGRSQRLLLFVNHWPSQSAPGKVRQQAALTVQNVIDLRMKEDAEVNIMMMGDYNVIDSDDPHPFNTVTLSQDSQNPMSDVHDLYMRDGSIPREVKRKMPLGSYFYVPGMVWNRLDRFFINSNLRDSGGLVASLGHYKIYTPSFLTKTYTYDDPQYYSFGSVVKGIPFRSVTTATTPETAGYSDHFPIIMGINGL